jgi:hypothetical protein
MKRRDHVLPAAVALAAVVALGGCQAIFTYSPVAALQRPPSSLTAEQRVTYAENALASGDAATMKAAYDAIKNDTGDTAQYLAAQLGFEASGVPSLLFDALTSGDTSGLIADGSTSITDFLTAHPDVDPDYLILAVGNFDDVQDKSGVETIDYVYAALGTVLADAQQPDGTYTFPVAGATVTAAAAYVTAAVASLPAGDPMLSILTNLNTYIATMDDP